MSVAANTSLPQRNLGGAKAIQVAFKGSDCAAGKKLYVTRVPYAFTIIGAYIEGDQSGSAVVTIGADDFPNIADLTTDKITASAPPTLSTALSNSDTTLTGWTTAFAAGKNLTFELTSVTTCAAVYVTLDVEA